MHIFPAVFPVRVGEEARQYFGIEVALAIEVAIKPAVRQAGSGHDLMESNSLKSIAVEELASAINDYSLYCGPVTNWGRHTGLLGSLRGRLCPEPASVLPVRIILRIILSSECL